MQTASQQWIAGLVDQMNQAVLAEGDAQRCRQVMEVFTHYIGDAECPLDSTLLDPVADSYGRRLLYRAPDGAYSIVLMIWGSGQGTPLHDHSGMWCVECVCKGTITVKSYDRLANLCSDSNLYNFECKEVIEAGVGEAGCLIPPFEYHIIENQGNETAATIHVYGGEILKCNVFVPQDSGYQLEVRELCYND
jgi:3-mercaptopropionate dioxygenase